MKPTVLIATTERWVPTARLAVAFSNAGFVVEVLCPSSHPVSTTGAARRIHGYNGLRPEASLAAAIAAARPDLIVPSDDLATGHLHQLHWSTLGRGDTEEKIRRLIERSIGAPESFPIVLARTPFINLALEQGVCAPKTEVITSSDDLKRCAKRIGFPLVLKADRTSGGDGVRIVNTMHEAESALRVLATPPLLTRAVKRAILDQDTTLLSPSILRRRSVVNAQEFVPGIEATSTLACWNGTILACLNFEVIRKTLYTGHATVLRMVENESMSIAAERVVRRLNLSGVHGLDFMLDARTGKAYLIEINPRSTQVGHLTLGPGRDLPAALFSAVSGEKVKPAPKMTENNIITLFPQEWMRDAASPYLQSGYHDVPWHLPDLVSACVSSRPKQSKWYSTRIESKPSFDPTSGCKQARCQSTGVIQ